MKKKYQLKILLIGLFVLIVNSNSFADQCAMISKKQASGALKHLKKGTTVYKFCAPCGDTFPTPITIRNVQISDSDENVQVYVNSNEEIDLAYVYVPSGQGNYVNLAILVGCPVSDVPKYLPEKKQLAQAPAQPQRLLDESFTVYASTHKPYSWQFNAPVALDINLSATSNVDIFIVDETSYWKYKAGESVYPVASRDDVLSASFEAQIPQAGTYYIVISNRAILTPANVSIQVYIRP